MDVNGEAPPLEEWLGDLLPTLSDYEESLKDGRLVPTHRNTYEIEANWKLLLENYLEYYHLPQVHPALCNVSAVDDHRRSQGKGMYMGFATDPLTKGGTALDPGRLPHFPTIRGVRTERAYHCAIFPNTFFSLYPDSFFRVILSPSGVNKTVEQATLLTHKGAVDAPDSKAILQDIYEFWNNVNTEDIGICETVQLGTENSMYTGGRFSFRFEEPIHRFQNMLVDKMLAQDDTRYRIPDGDEGFSDLPDADPEAASK